MYFLQILCKISVNFLRFSIIIFELNIIEHIKLNKEKVAAALQMHRSLNTPILPKIKITI